MSKIEAKYSATLESKLEQLKLDVVSNLLLPCTSLRTDLISAFSGQEWYLYSNEARKIADIISTIEHTVILLVQRINAVREKNWNLEET